jgi:ribonuclease P protein component
VIGRILRAVDFERVLGTPTRARSAHFAVHYLPGVPSRPAAPRRKAAAADLSTGSETAQPLAVEESVAPATEASLDACADARAGDVVGELADAGIWVGTVVPKRHARRAVTRNLLKRQIHRAVMAQAEAASASGLPAGLWVVRLRTPFDRKAFSSASSDALRLAAAEELGTVMAHAARRARG